MFTYNHEDYINDSSDEDEEQQFMGAAFNHFEEHYNHVLQEYIDPDDSPDGQSEMAEARDNYITHCCMDYGEDYIEPVTSDPDDFDIVRDVCIRYSEGEFDMYPIDDNVNSINDIEAQKRISSIYAHGDMRKAFEESCRNNYLHAAQWSYLFGYVHIRTYDKDSLIQLFKDVCSKGHLGIARWLYGIFISDIIKHCIDEEFVTTCRRNHLELVFSNNHSELAQRLHGTCISNTINHWIGDAFVAACSNHHLELAQWLYDLCNPHINQCVGEAFVSACSNNHLEIAHWLYKSVGIDIGKKKNEAFRGACSRGHLELARWLQKSCDIDIHHSNDGAFQDACYNGHLLVAQWLYDFGEVDIHYNKDKAFWYAYSRDHLLVAQWLYDLGGITLCMSNGELSPYRYYSAPKNTSTYNWLHYCYYKNLVQGNM